MPEAGHLALYPAEAGRGLLPPAGATDHRAATRRSPAVPTRSIARCPTAPRSLALPPRRLPQPPWPETVRHGVLEACRERPRQPRLPYHHGRVVVPVHDRPTGGGGGCTDKDVRPTARAPQPAPAK